MKKTCVMDSSAILALIGEEPGANKVAEHLVGSMMSALNWAEVLAVLQNIGMTSHDMDDVLKQLAIRIMPFDLEQATLAAALHRITHVKGLSLANRACIALARIHNIPVLTTQTAWSNLHVGTEIVIIRSH